MVFLLKFIQNLNNMIKILFRKVEYLPYGKCPGFEIFYGNGGCVSGHMVIKKTDTKEQIAFNMIGLVTRLCKEHNIPIQKTIDTITMNLRNNDLI